jgi:hypothetical protein
MQLEDETTRSRELQQAFAELRLQLRNEQEKGLSHEGNIVLLRHVWQDEMAEKVARIRKECNAAFENHGFNGFSIRNGSFHQASPSVPDSAMKAPSHSFETFPSSTMRTGFSPSSVITESKRNLYLDQNVFRKPARLGSNSEPSPLNTSTLPPIQAVLSSSELNRTLAETEAIVMSLCPA